MLNVDMADINISFTNKLFISQAINSLFFARNDIEYELGCI